MKVPRPTLPSPHFEEMHNMTSLEVTDQNQLEDCGYVKEKARNTNNKEKNKK